MELKDMNEKEFMIHLSGILGYISNLKSNEPGWSYDNFNEFEELQKKYEGLNSKNEFIISAMNLLKEEIKISKEKFKNPVRTLEEENFYKHIVGVNSFIRETKQKEPGWVFQKTIEVDGLLEKMESLQTKDPDIISIMRIITKDIIIVKKNLGGSKEVKQYKERLEDLGILEKKKGLFFK